MRWYAESDKKQFISLFDGVYGELLNPLQYFDYKQKKLKSFKKLSICWK